jgi:hypothetical protein
MSGNRVVFAQDIMATLEVSRATLKRDVATYLTVDADRRTNTFKFCSRCKALTWESLSNFLVRTFVQAIFDEAHKTASRHGSLADSGAIAQ